jgi:hypothetical protein
LNSNSDFFKNNVSYGFLLSDYLFQSPVANIFTFVWGGTTLSLGKLENASTLSFRIDISGEATTQTVTLPSSKPLGIILGFEGGVAKVYLNSSAPVMSLSVNSSTVQLSTAALMSVALGSGALSADLNEIVILGEGPTTAAPKFNAHWAKSYSIQVT